MFAPSSNSRIVLKPKSAIFARGGSGFSMRTLPGFRSRCRMGGSWPCRYCMPRATSMRTFCSCNIFTGSFNCAWHSSSNDPSLLRDFTYFPKSPSTIHSRTKHIAMLLSISRAVTPWNRTMLGCRMRLNSLISLTRDCACAFENWFSFHFGTLMAMSVLPSSTPRRTSPKPPERWRSISLNSMCSLGMSQCSFRPMVMISTRSMSLKISSVAVSEALP
mmetsp:Transcript_86443/g.239696  ORF Transcript_86443/g.239696 Transcript_86443/m.239696 type:complete len:218 (-) Transcript_86443:101-754(-)